MTMIDREFKQAAVPFFTGERPAFATTLVAALIKMFGLGALEWDPLTIQLEIQDALGVEMPRRVYDKMMALVTALLTDEVYRLVPTFDEFVNALTGHGVGAERDVPSVDHLAWAVTELVLNDPEPVGHTPDPEDQSSNPFSRNISKYVRVVLDDEGLTRSPEALWFAPSKPVKKEGFDDPEYYAGAWASAQARADEVDQFVEAATIQLLQQLMELGIDLQGPRTEQPDALEAQAEAPQRMEQKVAESRGTVHQDLTRLVRSRS